MKRTLRMGLLGLLAMVLLASCGKDKDKPYEPLEPALRKDYTEDAFGMQMEMVYVKGGEFWMGFTEDQGWDVPDSVAQQNLRKTKLDSYHIGKYEVTQGQWLAVMGTTLEEQRALSGYLYIVGEGNDYPMYYVNWNEAQEFCKRLSEKTGKKYVLPTEAMWEYAARGGVHKTKTMYAGSNDIDEVAWCWGNSGEGLEKTDPDYGTHRVGTKKANALGIYDMSGNVEEWCSDWHAKEYDPEDDHNPQGPTEEFGRVRRGGDWCGGSWYHSYERICRVSYRSGLYPGNRYYGRGFRVAVLL